MGFAKTAAALVFVLACGAAHAYFATGADILAAFESQDRIRAKQASASETAHTLRMVGYIQGVLDSAQSGGLICPAGTGLTLRKAEPIITQYLQANPKMLKVAAVDSVMFALHPHFKCP